MLQFPGMEIVDVMVLVCKSVGDDGEALMEEFLELVDDSVKAEVNSVFSKCMNEISL